MSRMRQGGSRRPLGVEVYNAPATGVVHVWSENHRPGRGGHGGWRLAVEDAVDPTVGFVITGETRGQSPGGEPIGLGIREGSGGDQLGFERSSRRS